MDPQPTWLVEMLERKAALEREIEFINETVRRWREQSGLMRRKAGKQKEAPVLTAVLQALPRNGDALDASQIYERIQEIDSGISWKSPDRVMRELLRRYPDKIERGGRKRYRLAEIHRRTLEAEPEQNPESGGHES